MVWIGSASACGVTHDYHITTGTGSFMLTKESLHGLLRRFAKMKLKHSAFALPQRLEIAQRLSCFEHAEGVGLAWHGKIHWILGREEEKRGSIRSSLMKLAGGVEVAGTVTQHRRDTTNFSQTVSQCLDGGIE